MISNIIDRRTRQYRWKKITAIVEPTDHDDAVSGSDEEIPEPGSIVYDERAEISVADAIAWAASLPFAATSPSVRLGSGIKSRA